MGRVLTVEQVAEMLQLNPQVVRQYLREGKLPGRKIGRHWRVWEEDVSGYMRQLRQSPAMEASMVHETAAKYEPERDWKDLTQEERIERLKSVRGALKDCGWSSEDFMREKHREIEEEERRWEEKHRR